MNSDRPSLPATLAFRFATVYFILYSLCIMSPPPLSYGWELLASWVGTHVLSIDSISFRPTGSGDTTYAFVLSFTFAVLASVACLGWTAIDRGHTTHPRFAACLTVWARYWLGMTMISYGIVKVFPLQFPFPDPVQLGQTYGDSSPMGLMWTFMGYSPVYSAFAGGAEMLGGALLFWRRTTSLGALICIGVLANIVVLNFSYDVPVKLFSFHLLVVAVVLAGQDAQRLIGVLVLNRAVPARVTPPITVTLRGHRIRWTLKGLVLVGMAAMLAFTVRDGRDLLARTPPLYGSYDVVAHELECEPSRSCGDELRWDRVAFGRHDRLALDPLQGPRTIHRVDIDGPSELVLTSNDGGPVMMMNYHEPVEGTLILEGSVGGVQHRITLQRMEPLLVRRGFNWINETPFNI